MARTKKALRTRATRAAAEALHEKLCGSPPSCEVRDPFKCSPAGIFKDEVEPMADAVLVVANGDR